MSDERSIEDQMEELPWPQKMVDNLWLLLAIGILIPALIYLGWGLWELAELPTWGGR